MSVSLTSANFNVSGFILALSLSFLIAAFLLCFCIMVRRFLRNRKAAKRAEQKLEFQRFLSEVMISKTSDKQALMQAPRCHIHDKTDVFLHYFRTLKGQKLEDLSEMISASTLESEIAESTKQGVRGSRMRGLRTLSYLNSQTSLQVIFDTLSSEDKYVRLTASRCLVRREALFFLNTIVESINDAFPKDFHLLAGILAEFGDDAVQPLEGIVEITENEVIGTACLEALVMIRPTQTALDLSEFIQHESETVRAAALSLSAIAEHSRTSDLLAYSLQDDSISVKLRATKMAGSLKRADLTPALYKLATDPAMWVRYNALKAIWMSGQSGQKFVGTLSTDNEMAANVSLEMTSGYV